MTKMYSLKAKSKKALLRKKENSNVNREESMKNLSG
jgi:hypothetical protein